MIGDGDGVGLPLGLELVLSLGLEVAVSRMALGDNGMTQACHTPPSVS